MDRRNQKANANKRLVEQWGYFVFGCVALFWIVYVILISGRGHARALGPDVSKAYTTVGGYLIFLWFLYPIAWGLSEGGNVIAPDSEAIFYGVLDVLTKVVYGGLLLWSHRNIDPAILGRTSIFFSFFFFSIDGHRVC